MKIHHSRETDTNTLNLFTNQLTIALLDFYVKPEELRF